MNTEIKQNVAALNNNIPLISCILTDLGKQIISDSPSEFKITKFSVTDDEVDYQNLSYNSLSGMKFLYFYSDTNYLSNASNIYSASTNIFSGLTDISFSFFIKILENPVSGIESPIISWGTDTANRIAISLRHKKMEVVCATGTNIYVQTEDNIIAQNEWTNIIIKYDLTQVTNTDRIKIYKNGIQLTSLTFSGTVPTILGSLTSQIALGKFPYVLPFDNQYQTFLVKNMLCYNGLLDNSEISSITANGVNSLSYPSNRSGLTAIGIWNFNEGSGNFTKDLSVNKLDLTFNEDSPYWGKVANLNLLVNDSNSNVTKLNNYVTTLPKNTNKIFNISLDKEEITITNNDIGSCTLTTIESLEELGYTIYINTDNIDITPSNQVYRLKDAELKRIEIERKLKQIDEIAYQKKFQNIMKPFSVKTITCEDTFQIIGKGIIGIYNIMIVGNSSGAIKNLTINVKL